jgi:hypothetical protein
VTIDGSQNVGIGTSNPATPLHIYASTQEQVRLGRNSTSSSAYLTFFANNASSAQVQYAGILGDVVSSTAGSHGGALLFYTTGSGTSAERARIDSNGNFGVGVTPAAWGSGESAIQTKYGTLAGSSGINIASNAYYNAGWKYINTASATWYSQSSGAHIWNTAGSGTAGNAISFTQAMTLNASGNLGVGTSSPGVRLDVVGTGGVLTGTARYVARVLQDQTTYRGVALGYDTSGQIGIIYPESAGAASSLTFWTYSGSAWAERMRIDSSANILVNITSAPISASGGLYVAGLISPYSNYSPSSNIGGQIAFAGAQGSPVCGRVYMGDNTGWQWEWGPYGGSGWVRRFYFTDGGAAYSTTGTWGTISDATLKENIVDATSKLAELMQLRVRNFNFISEPGVKQLGFVAQEVEQVFPRLVDTTRPDENGNSTKAVKTTVLIPMLVKAIQELNERLEALEAKTWPA